MSLVSHAGAEAELAQLIERFEHWRQTRSTRREPIPDWLWEPATQLTASLPLARVAKRLRLNRQELKKQGEPYRQANPDAPAALPVAGFIEVKAEPDWLAAGMEIDLQRPDGARLRIHYRAPPPPLTAVVQTVLEAR